ncbi:hypothetical protein HIM_02255 [Hirsutella minnesotensis 3608]|nr:hypothetical protein HIM_02255 [Hirsutella minnesotensis 3608]
MVQVLADPAHPQAGSHIHEAAEARKQEGMMTREEHAQRAKELSMSRGKTRAPRRGWTMMEYRDDHESTHHAYGAALLAELQAPIPENSPLPAYDTPLSTATIEKVAQLPRRPKLPPPRRSHSVTDKEPESVAPGHPRPSGRMTLLDLPSEIHYDLFDFLDPIDGVCLGLAHSRLYNIHRRKYGKVPLSSRYDGPNTMEWAWRGAGPLIRPTQPANEETSNPLERLRVRGQVYCRKCGISRCELHRHIKDWMGSAYEYCEIRKMYGPPAGEDAKSYCFMSSPKNPYRCGRHGGKRPLGAVESIAPPPREEQLVEKK